MNNQRWRLSLLSSLLLLSSAAQPVIIYETGFERSEGYQSNQALIGQLGWEGLGLEGHSVEDFDDYGRTALVGFYQPLEEDGVKPNSISVWRPLRFDPLGESLPIVDFSVFFEIVPSEVGENDEFRWSAFNLNEEPLFKFNFDTFSGEISFSSDGGENFDLLGFNFQPGGFYHFAVTMNFERNLLSATLNGLVIANGLPITATDAELTLGDIDAVWVLIDPENPGDNFMLFDDYRVIASSIGSIPSIVEVIPNREEETFSLLVFGEPDRVYTLEESSNLNDWTPLSSIAAPADGIIELVTRNSMDNRPVFYRAWTP